jgi:hypothetical protein
MDLGVILMRPVAEIEPESVDARDRQRPQHLGRGACRSDGRDNLSSAMTTHGSIGHFGRPHDQNGANVGDIGERRSGADEITNAVEESEKRWLSHAHIHSATIHSTSGAT